MIAPTLLLVGVQHCWTPITQSSTAISERSMSAVDLLLVPSSTGLSLCGPNPRTKANLP